MAHILIVDDDPNIHTLLVRILGKMGHTACNADSGKRAEQLAASEQPDVILMDFLMPLQDGAITSRNIREMGYTGSIIIMSALATAANDPDGCGANAFLRKPLDIEQLGECIDNLTQVHSL